MTQTLCVASVPAGHPYIARALAAPIGAPVQVRVVPDPQPVGAPAGQWWPPAIVASGWIDSHRSDADLLHLHFGLESFTVDELVAAVDAAHDAGWPVVYTVHDLENPQLVDQAPHVRQLDALLPLVDAVVTLTPGAASEIAERWGRTALVLPHPRLLPDDVEPSRGLAHDLPVIGVHLKDLRPSVDGAASVRILLGALDLLRDRGVSTTGEVRLHRSVRDDEQREQIRFLCAERSDVVLIEHNRLDDEALAEALAHLDVCVLPYHSGTHSGWLELCWDLGVAVAVPDVGYLREQHDDEATIAGFSREGLDGDRVESLAGAIARLLDSAPESGSEARHDLAVRRLEERTMTDEMTARAHADLYSDLLAERS